MLPREVEQRDVTATLDLEDNVSIANLGPDVILLKKKKQKMLKFLKA
jgi:hypothetical protein